MKETSVEAVNDSGRRRSFGPLGLFPAGLGLAPYLWLGFLFIPFLTLALDGAEPWRWAAQVGVAALGALTSLAGFRDGLSHRNWFPVVVFVFLGTAAVILVSPANWGLFVYGASLAGFRSNWRSAVVGLVLTGLGPTLLLLLGFLGGNSFLFCLLMIASVGGGNLGLYRHFEIHRALSLANQEIARLAQLAERERIARDLHDLLGHSLSLMILKAELARRLAASDIARAASEIGDVERVAREALNQVRAAVTGYRSGGLSAEIVSSRSALASAGIETDHWLSVESVPPAIDGTLALVLREAVTNVLRHSGARHCSVTVEEAAGFVSLTVRDDGDGFGAPESGSGIQGMRERVAALGGSLEIAHGDGTTVRALLRLPTTVR